MGSKGRSAALSVDERYTQWKSLVPVLYDWLANHNLVWPSLSCRWGPQFEQAIYKNRQRLYLYEQTDGSVPNTLVVANCEIVKPRVAAAEHISQWCPDKASVFGSSAEDGFLNIWDHEKVGKKKERATTRMAANSIPGLFFQHAGHRDKVVDFHWNASDPWTIVSVSDDCESTGGGGTLQIWRMSDLIYRPEEEVLEELEKFKSHILSCKA